MPCHYLDTDQETDAIERRAMLFSDGGIAAGTEGLTAIKDVVHKYEKIVRSRESKSE